MLITRDLGLASIAKMAHVDLASLDAEPDSEIETFDFHGCTCGVSAFRGRPPWEKHAGDELLLILAGTTTLTILEGGAPTARELSQGQLAVVPMGHWHSNDAPLGVTMLWMTPREGNEHTFDQPPS